MDVIIVLLAIATMVVYRDSAMILMMVWALVYAAFCFSIMEARMNIASIIQSGRAIRGRIGDMVVYADPWDLSTPKTPHENRYMCRVHYKIIHDPCDVKLHDDLLLSREDLDCILRLKTLDIGAVVESTNGWRSRVVRGRCGAYRLERM